MDFKKFFAPDRIAYGALLATIALLPIFCLPYLNMTLDSSKGFLLSTGVLVSFGFWIVARLMEGRITIPRSPIHIGALGVAAVTAVAALVSDSIDASFWGKSFEVGTASMIIVFSLLLLLVSVYFQNKKHVESLAYVFFGSFAVVFLFQIVHFFVPLESVFNGFFASTTATVVGKWNDFAIFSGLVAVLSLFLLETISLDKWKKIALSCLLGGSIFMLLASNLLSAWILFGIGALIIFAYVLAPRKQSLKTDIAPRRSFPILPFALFVFATLFVLGNSFVGSFVPTKLGVLSLEIRPSVSTTAMIVGQSIAEHPVFGFGPNRFANAWLLFKPASVNMSAFWNTDFNAGSGLIPSFFVMTGLLGLFAWIFFLSTVIWQFIRAKIFSAKQEDRHVLMCSFLATAYLWLISIIYVPNNTLFAFAFIATGTFIGILVQKKLITSWTYALYGAKVRNFLSIVLVSGALLSTLGLGYVVVKEFIANVYVAKAAVAANNASLDEAERFLLRSLAIDPNDNTYTLLAQVYIAKTNAILAKKDVSIEEVKPDVQALLGSAMQANLSAVAYDEKNYLNALALGSFYQVVLPLGFPDAYENARREYERALSLNPRAPQIYLSLADLALTNKDVPVAKEYVAQALALKSDYVDAYFALAKIARDAGDNDQVLIELEKAAAANPTDFDVFFTIGMTHYGVKDYTNAIIAFERAVRIRPSDLNGHYFLGLAYDGDGRTEEALVQFKLLLSEYPDNQQLAEIIANIEAGRNALDASEEE